jgi:hypothetical protein
MSVLFICIASIYMLLVGINLIVVVSLSLVDTSL